jgi:hypothetical protein
LERDRYDDLLDRYVEACRGRDDVVGVVAVGSTAALGRQPDPWSDHDILVMARHGAAAALRRDLSWVPDNDRLVLQHAETLHGLMLLHGDGHLVELAVFEPDELDGVSLEDYRVLLDRGGVAELMESLERRTAAAAADRRAVAARAFALFAKQIVVGVNRHRRGEWLSAHDRVRGEAVRHLLALSDPGGPGSSHPAACTVDPFRRFERIRPDLAPEVSAALCRPVPETARALVDLAAVEAARCGVAHAAAVVATLDALLDAER